MEGRLAAWQDDWGTLVAGWMGTKAESNRDFFVLTSFARGLLATSGLRHEHTRPLLYTPPTRTRYANVLLVCHERPRSSTNNSRLSSESCLSRAATPRAEYYFPVEALFTHSPTRPICFLTAATSLADSLAVSRVCCFLLLAARQQANSR